MPKAEVGKRYRITHARKGTFEGEIMTIDDEWVRVRITKGSARHLANPDRGEGEQLDFRVAHATFEPL